MTRIRLQSPPKASKWVNMSPNGSKASQINQGQLWGPFGVHISEVVVCVSVCDLVCVLVWLNNLASSRWVQEQQWRCFVLAWIRKLCSAWLYFLALSYLTVCSSLSFAEPGALLDLHQHHPLIILSYLAHHSFWARSSWSSSALNDCLFLSGELYIIHITLLSNHSLHFFSVPIIDVSQSEIKTDHDGEVWQEKEANSIGLLPNFPCREFPFCSGVAMATLKHFVISSLRAVDDTHLVPSPTFSPAPFFLLLAFALFSISIQLALIKKAEFRYMIWGKRRDSEDSDMPPSPHHDHLICRSFSRRLGTGAPPSPHRQHTTLGTHWTSGITHKTQDNTLHNKRT